MALVLIGFILIALIDLTPLMHQRKTRAITAFLIIFTVALLLAILQALNIEVPSIMHAWRNLLHWMGLEYPS